MSSQIRYRTLVDHLARIYEATDETRTGRLQEGLTKVLETIDPKGADGWQHVKVDSMRLLRVWRAREDCQGDSTLADQILEALSDFATEDMPRLEISERPAAPVAAAVVVTPPSEAITEAITASDAAAIEAALAADDDEDEEAEPVAEEAETEEDETDEDEDDAEADEEATAPAPAETKPVAAPAPAAEEEVVEPEADSDEEEADEEEDEEGVEVEKRTIRGREYWLSSDGTLYAVTEDDEIGDEVGRITKEGRPVFLAPK